MHSSEIYEIGPLLSEGDLLLTTGLGLAGADAGARRHWVRDLAARGVAAVALELGRSLATLPEEVSDEARRQGLPLLELQDVVPFVRICEEANSAVLDADGRRLRAVDALVGQVHTALAAGGGTSALVECAARQLGAPVALVTRAQQVVAVAGVAGERDTDRLLRRPAARAPVRVWDVEWGAVLLGPCATDPRTLDLAAPRLAGAAALVLGREGAGGPSDLVAPFLADLLSGALTVEREVLVRAGLAGLHPARGAAVVGLAATSPDPDAVVAAWRREGPAHGVDLVAHRVRGEVLGLAAAVPHDGTPDVATRVARVVVDARCVVTVGPAVAPADAARSVQEAHAALPTANLLGQSPALTRDLALATLLAGTEPASLQRLVDDALGPLVDWDRAHGSDLVRTVTVHLRHGCSATRTARVLHLQRQSLYQRLARAEALLGRPLDDPAGHEHLVVATCAHRLAEARRRTR
ncbi:hypothetical protein GCM10027194_05780 [Thalassiella azotivora]